MFVCGLQNPEDVVLVPNTAWLLTSGMAPGAGLTAVDTRSKALRKLYAPAVANVRADRSRFANCPAPLDATQAVLHGLALRPAAGGRFTVYATNHAVLRGAFYLPRVSSDGGTRDVGAQQAEQREKDGAFRFLDHFPSRHIWPRQASLNTPACNQSQ